MYDCKQEEKYAYFILISLAKTNNRHKSKYAQKFKVKTECLSILMISWN